MGCRGSRGGCDGEREIRRVSAGKECAKRCHGQDDARHLEPPWCKVLVCLHKARKLSPVARGHDPGEHECCQPEEGSDQEERQGAEGWCGGHRGESLQGGDTLRG